MDARMQAALVASREDAMIAASKRLGRALTSEERKGIEAIHSLMMLESTYRSFTSEKYPADSVERDLRHFAEKARTG